MSVGYLIQIEQTTECLNCQARSAENVLRHLLLSLLYILFVDLCNVADNMQPTLILNKQVNFLKSFP